MTAIKLTVHTDYALRVLLLAAANPGTRLSIADVAQQQGISRNHLMKVINQLANTGLLETIRGRGGGFTLAHSPETIKLGDVIRHTEPNMQPADCGACVLKPGCGLNPILNEAMSAFMAVLDQQSLADALVNSQFDFMQFDSPAMTDERPTGAD